MSLGEFELVYDDTDDLELVSGELTGPFGSAALPFPAGGIVGGMDTRTLMSFAEFELLDAGADDVELGYLVSRNPQCWRRPDLSLTRPDQPGERYYEGAPLVVFEVVSEYDTATRLDKKVADYLANGAAEVWVIYPELRHAWVYRGAGLTTTRETEAIHSELLPGVEIPLDEILQEFELLRKDAPASGRWQAEACPPKQASDLLLVAQTVSSALEAP
jgi:hypothetical protein